MAKNNCITKKKPRGGEFPRFSGRPELTIQEVKKAKTRSKNDLQVQSRILGNSGKIKHEVQDVADSLHIHPFMLSRWRKQVQKGTIVTKGTDIYKEVAAELKELR